MFKLRDYQTQAINIIQYEFTRENRQYIEMPTGSGKTVTFLSYASMFHKKILIIVPSKQLLNQVYSTALNFYHKSEISRKGNNFDEKISKLHICIINSIRGDYLDILLNNEFDLMIVDEAHHCASSSYNNFIKKYFKTFTNCKLLGLTATPTRSDGLKIEEIFNSCTYRISIQSLIECRHLCDIDGYTVKTKIDITDIDSHNGDYSINQLYKKLCVESRNKMIFDICKNEMKDKKTLIFCINVKHSKIICKMLNDDGLSAAHIDGTMKELERQSILKSFRDGNIDFLCNCQLLTEGFDEPCIEGLVLTRPTNSRSLFIQMIGRGLRNFPGKTECKIIDIVDNNKYACNFNSIYTFEFFPPIDRAKGISSIQDYIGKKKLELADFTIERSNFFEDSLINDFYASDSMIKYLDSNQIQYFHPISFDEANFLIWFNEIKKECKCL